MTTRVHLIRHASYSQLGATLAGRSDHPLDAAGRAQAARVAASFATADIAAILTSPVRRARETAEAIAAPHGRAPVVEPGFNEIDFGAWQGLGFDRLAGDRDWAEWNARRGLAPTPGGETMLAVQARAVAALQHLPARYPDGELVVVSHGDVINAVLLHLLGMPLDLLHRLRIDPAGRSTLMLYGGDAEVICVNVAA